MTNILLITKTRFLNIKTRLRTLMVYFPRKHQFRGFLGKMWVFISLYVGFNCIVSTLCGLETNCSPWDRFCITRMVSSTYRNHTKGSKNASPISRLFDRLLPYIVYSMQYWLRSASGCCRVRVFFLCLRQPFLFSTLRSFSASKSLPCKFSASEEKKKQKPLLPRVRPRPRNCRYCLHRFSHVR